LFIVRWVAGDNEEDVLTAVVTAPQTAQQSICEITFDHAGGDLIQMDAADDAQ
jgi:hypothetical protein